MNRTKRKKKAVWQQYIGIVFMLLTGLICGEVMAMYLLDHSAPDIPLYQEIFPLIGLFLGIYVSFFFHTIAHEAGHLHSWRLVLGLNDRWVLF